jgi:hypothetical protein
MRFGKTNRTLFLKRGAPHDADNEAQDEDLELQSHRNSRMKATFAIAAGHGA